jgi:hypothetical protein
MRAFLSLALLFVVPVFASADPLVVTVTDKDKDGKKMEKNRRTITIHMIYSADREKRLIQFLKNQELLEKQPWLEWQKTKRKDNDVVTYQVTTDINPGWLTFRMIRDTEVEKAFVVDGHASLAGMQALSGDNFQLYFLGNPHIYGPKKY